MANKRIKHNDLFAPKITKNIIKELDLLVEKGAETEKELKKILEVLTNIKKIKSADGLKDFIAQTEKLTVAQKDQQETRKKGLELGKKIAAEAKKLTKVQQDRVKLEKQLKAANSDTIQDNEEIKVQLQEQRKANKELAKDKLGLINAYDKESKRLNLLRKQYKSLRIEEGKETKATRKLKTEIQRLDRELKEVDESAGQFQRNVGGYPQVFGKATNSIIATAAAAIGLNLSFSGIGAAAQGSVAGSENLRKVTSAVSGGISQLANVTASSIVDLFNFGKAIASGEKELGDISDAFTETSEAAENFTDKIVKSGEQGIEIAQSFIELEKASRPLEVAIAALNKVIDVQGVIAGDTTRSFAEQAEAAVKAQNAQTIRANILIKLASEELRISNLQVAQAEAAGGATVELLDAQTAAIVKLQEARNTAATEEIETEKILREIKRDRFEKELDFAIDAFDATKTSLERQIALEDQSFIQRAENLDKLKVLSDSAFQSQIDLLEAQVGQGVNIRELTKLEDERLIRARLINDSSLTDEIVLQRILEVIRERKTVTLDIADAEREVTAALKEQLKESDELFNDILSTRAEGAIAAEEDEEKSRQLRRDELIRQSEFELNLYAEGSDEQVLIKEQLNNDLAALDRERVDSEIANEMRLENARQTIQDARLSSAKSAAEILSIIAGDDEQAQENVKKAQQAIAVTEILINLNRQESAIRAEAAKAGDKGTTLERSQITAARFSAFAGIAAVLSAFDGVDDTGGRGGVDTKGGKYWVLHPNEQVHSLKDRQDMADPSTGRLRDRQELKDIVTLHDSGYLIPSRINRSDIGTQQISFDKIIQNQNQNADKIAKSIAANSTDFRTGFDDLGRMWMSTRKGGNSEKVVYQIPKTVV